MEISRGRTIVYIDGFNLYFSMREQKWRKHYWLNVQAFAQSLTRESHLEKVKYFTSRISQDGNDKGKRKRQAIYLEALSTLPNTNLYFGQYRERDPIPCKCGNRIVVPEEKMTDVNIATEMLVDAFFDRFDKALLVTADSDLCAPVRAIKEDFAEKKVVICFPPHRWVKSLADSAHGYFFIKESHLSRNQLKEKLISKSGYELCRPAEWR